ncbi:PAS/PAC sensor signal transduction histidine kinase [Oscillochloris trichoides DG-6]|uniref:PAS/PAC sensor signal transduction histidine kinase n=1 Tax=Oscillochloris trichoides DG-6 TaxID=765420 RepID=E1IA74_9CHLR|nr:V4R domain-containing protein [Oscillochloris trichoides]EFO81828.1 PAS/PAC sensor signal transduction histidine kinase [Oscillochloris trichoides DG-6]
MKATDFNMQQSLQFMPQQGLLKLGDSRVIVMGTEAMGALYQELFNVGDLIATQVVMRRFGEANGRERARMVKAAMQPDDQMEWLSFGPTLHAWEGLGLPKLAALEHDAATKKFRLLVEFKGSYLAEQYMRVMGAANEPVCWQLAGYIAGYCSEIFGMDMHCRETKCVAKGDPHCEFDTRPRGEWL